MNYDKTKRGDALFTIAVGLLTAALSLWALWPSPASEQQVPITSPPTPRSP